MIHETVIKLIKAKVIQNGVQTHKELCDPKLQAYMLIPKLPPKQLHAWTADSLQAGVLLAVCTVPGT